MITKERKIELAHLLRNHIAGHIEDAIGGDEHIVKEVLENLDTDEEWSFLQAELTQIRDQILAELR